MIRDFWSQNSSNLEFKLFVCKKCIQKWNLEYFGNTFSRKKRLINRLEGTSSVLSRCYNPFLENLKQELLGEYNIILEQEAEFRKQKSRLHWLRDGDRNTKFYYLSTVLGDEEIKLLN